MSGIKGLDIVNKKLERMLAIGGLDRDAYLELANILKTEMQENFRVGGRPQPWPISGRVRAFGGQTLRMTGRLMNSLTPFADESGGGVSTNLKYARIHATGGTIRAKNSEFLTFRVPAGLTTASKSGKQLKKPRKNFSVVRVKQVTIPRRDFRYISPKGAEFIVSAAGRRLIIGGTRG